jgi:hypothetical protein
MRRLTFQDVRVKLTFATLLTLSFVLPMLAAPNTRIKIDTVPSEYIPVNSPTNREPVLLSSFHFEVNQETGRARLVVEYTYPDQLIYGADDPTRGPASTIVQLPKLTYDSGAHTVTYDSNGRKVACATVSEKRGFFGRHLDVKNTGSCTVSTELAQHAEDDGWGIHRFRAIDTYLNIR